MKVAIHNCPGSFSDRWIEYCKENGIGYKVVNAYDNDIVNQLKGCDAFMWHHHHANYKDKLFAKQLLYSLQTIGLKVFPDFNTVWHFDDKVGQKYLLESVDAPLVPSYVFYTREDALNWIAHTSFPKVFKLRGGAGSQNVMLVLDAGAAGNLVKKAFGKGFPQRKISNLISENKRKLRESKITLYGFFKDILAYYLKPGTFHKMHSPEKGYVYFQDFIPDNDHDTRIVVIGEKYALGEMRYCREGDFRASGSGKFQYENIDMQCVKIAFDIAQKLKLQSVAFDFIEDKSKKQPLIVEMSYGFGTHGIEHSGGYWTTDLQWHPSENIDFCGWMVEDLIK